MIYVQILNLVEDVSELVGGCSPQYVSEEIRSLARARSHVTRRTGLALAEVVCERLEQLEQLERKAAYVHQPDISLTITALLMCHSASSCWVATRRRCSRSVRQTSTCSEITLLGAYGLVYGRVVSIIVSEQC